MSHVVTTKVSVLPEHFDCFAATCEDCGMEFKFGQKTHAWYGHFANDYHQEDAAVTQGFDPKTFGTCEHAASVKGKPDAYEVGLVKRPDGKPGYNVLFDFYAGGRGLMEHISPDGGRGQTGGKLMSRYTERVAEKELRSRGFGVQRRVNERGHVVLEAVRISR